MHKSMLQGSLRVQMFKRVEECVDVQYECVLGKSEEPVPSAVDHHTLMRNTALAWGGRNRLRPDAVVFTAQRSLETVTSLQTLWGHTSPRWIFRCRALELFPLFFFLEVFPNVAHRSGPVPNFLSWLFVLIVVMVGLQQTSKLFNFCNP